MKGKRKCKMLKEIRRKIAQENDIEYVTSECKYQGDCLGTCPKCEAELRYLEEELMKRQRAGKTIAIAGIAAAVMMSTAGCEITDIFNPSKGGSTGNQSESYDGDMTDDSQTEIDGNVIKGEELPADDPETDSDNNQSMEEDVTMGDPFVYED